MSISCDCSVDIDERPSFSNETFPKAKKTHRCCECREDIKPGDKYNRIEGVWYGEFLTFKTCMACHRIRKHYCSSGYIFEELREQIMECIGFDYTEVPDEEDDD